MNEAQQHPLRHQPSLPRDHALQKGAVGPCRRCGVGIVASDCIVRKGLQTVHIATGCKKLEGADAQMACRHPRQHRTRLHRIAVYGFTGGDGGQRTRGRHTHRRHSLAQNVFPKHRPQRGTAVAAAGERRRAGTLQLHIEPKTAAVYHFSQHPGTPVAKLRYKVAELMAGVGLRQRLRAHCYNIAGQHLYAFRAGQH